MLKVKDVTIKMFYVPFYRILSKAIIIELRRRERKKLHLWWSLLLSVCDSVGLSERGQTCRKKLRFQKNVDKHIDSDGLI